MIIFKLQPNDKNLNDANWQASTYQGPMVIRAEDENRARDIADTACGIAVSNRDPNGVIREIPTNPWSNLGLVQCIELQDSSYPSEGDVEILEPAYLNANWQNHT